MEQRSDIKISNGDLISRSALLKDNSFFMWSRQRDAVEDAPAVDAVEVVRCKDCNYRYQYEDWDRQSQEVIVCHECRVLRKDFGDDGFCSYGERRNRE